jgi:hypothetical protein
VKGFTASASRGRGRLWASLLFCLTFLGCGGGGGVSTRPPSGGGGGGGGNTGGTPEIITITTPANINCVQSMPFSLTLQATGNLTPIT